MTYGGISTIKSLKRAKRWQMSYNIVIESDEEKTLYIDIEQIKEYLQYTKQSYSVNETIDHNKTNIITTNLREFE